MSQRFQFHTQLFLKALSASVVDSKFILFCNKSSTLCLCLLQSRGIQSWRRTEGFSSSCFAQHKSIQNS